MGNINIEQIMEEIRADNTTMLIKWNMTKTIVNFMLMDRKIVLYEIK